MLKILSDIIVNFGIFGRVYLSNRRRIGWIFLRTDLLFVKYLLAPLLMAVFSGWKSHLCIELLVLPEKIHTELRQSDDGINDQSIIRKDPSINQLSIIDQLSINYQYQPTVSSLPVFEREGWPPRQSYPLNKQISM